MNHINVSVRAIAQQWEEWGHIILDDIHIVPVGKGRHYPDCPDACTYAVAQSELEHRGLYGPYGQGAIAAAKALRALEPLSKKPVPQPEHAEHQEPDCSDCDAIHEWQNIQTAFKHLMSLEPTEVEE